MSKIYGYCRISTSAQSIDRQVRNIQEAYKEAIILKETFTGTKTLERPMFKKLLGQVKEGDTIVFDSVSRMSRNAEEGIEIYLRLYNQGVNLVFLKEQHINTDTYKKALSNNIELTNTNLDLLLEGINKYLMSLAEEQIRLAFEQAQKEVDDLRQRTKEGILSAKLSGKQIGLPRGSKLITKKSIESKKLILQYNKDFNGTLNDKMTMKLIGISSNTYYRYKKDLKNEITE